MARPIDLPYFTLFKEHLGRGLPLSCSVTPFIRAPGPVLLKLAFHMPCTHNMHGGASCANVDMLSCSRCGSVWLPAWLNSRSWAFNTSVCVLVCP